jgi:hypothetical protein
MTNKLFAFGILLLALLFLTQCSRKPKNEFERARDFVKSQCTEKFFKEKDPTFVSIEGSHKPSDWLKYFFSVMSTRNWITEDDEYAEYTRGPVLPKSITLQPSFPNPNTNKSQLVIIADDEKNRIFVKGYDSTKSSIVFKDEWDFPYLLH